MLDTLPAFIGISLVVIVTPGPDTAVTIRSTLLGGRAGGVATALGVAVGQAIWAIATSIGVVAVLVASEPLFLAIKYAGAAYLVLLGVRSLWDAVRQRDDATPGPAGSRLGRRAAFRQGLVSNLGNPKMAVFFASLLPQFVPAEADPSGALPALGLGFSLMTFAWLAAYAAVVARAGDVLRRTAVRRAIEAATGSVLVALGARIATEAR